MSHYQAKRIDRLKDQLSDERAARQDQLRTMATSHSVAMALAESRRLDAVMTAEARRVDANRSTDVAAVVLANARAELTAAALAERVDTSAKALAEGTAATAKAAASETANTATALGGRIKPLEDARYEQAGQRGARGDISRVIYAIAGLIIGPIIYIVATHVH